jgi:hypothetical protein
MIRLQIRRDAWAARGLRLEAPLAGYEPPEKGVTFQSTGGPMKLMWVILLSGAFIATCAAQGLPEPRRTSFVDVAYKSCFKSQTENPVNQGLNKGLSVASLAQYCACFANKLADSTSLAELAELDSLSLRDPVAVAARQGPLITSLGDKCAEEVWK